MQAGNQRVYQLPPPALPPTPGELPLDVYGFAGRVGELDELDAMLAEDVQASSPVVISAVSGTAGVGKTALAVHWAHRRASQFPDGILYVDLRGYDPDEPVPAGEALAAFLRALGVRGAEIPLELAERAARYRTLLSGRRMLVVLDNAQSVEQIRLLLPGTRSCFVIVTSRDRLTALVARHGARRIDLDLLSPAEAIDLLRNMTGRRINSEPAAAAELASLCARLPLALRIAAELVVARSAATITDLISELIDERHRLDLLDAGDPRTAVRAVFSWSYRHLPEDAARAFRWMGLHAARDYDVYGIAALTSTGVTEARRLINMLVRAHLVEETSAGRFRMHDLLRIYAAEQAAHEDAEPDRRSALTRLFDHYLSTAAAAMDTAFPAEQDRRPRVGAQAVPAPPVSEPVHARAWLDGQRLNLIAATAHCAAYGWPSHAKRIAATIRRYLDTHAYYADALVIHGHALRAARAENDRAGEAMALHNLGSVHSQMGSYGDALGHLIPALDLYRRAGDRAGEANTLDNLGGAYWGLGRHEEALDHYQQALAANREAGNRASEGRTQNNLGVVCLRLGRYDEAVIHLERALAIAGEIGDRPAQGTLNNLGVAYQRLGRYDAALNRLQQALDVSREAGYRAAEAAALDSLGANYRHLKRYREAIEHHQRALALAREIRHRGLEADILNGFGETLQAAGRPTDASSHHASALRLAREIGDRYEEGRALSGIALALHSTDHVDDARRLWRDALAIYTDMDMAVPETDEIRRHLASSDPLDADGD